jgi:hypothetical protein
LWFALLLLTIGGFLVIFFDPNMSVALSLGKNGEFASLSLILWRFWVLFLLPLAGISVLLAAIIWLKDKIGNSYRGFIALMTTLLTLGLLFLFIPKLSILDQDIKSNTGIFKMPMIEPKPAPVFSPSLEELNAIGKTSIDKSDWQTYKNDYYGFEIMGPKSWSIKPSNDTGIFDNTNVTDPAMGNYLSFKPDSVYPSDDQFYAPLNLTVQENPDNLSITKWFLKKYTKFSEGPENFIKIEIPSAEEAVAVFHNFYNNQGIYSYYVKKNNKIYNFNLVDSNPDSKNGSAMMNAIVMTLRFK